MSFTTRWCGWWGERARFPPAAGFGILRVMTKLFDQAVDTVRALPPDAQDEFARLLLQLAGQEQPPIALTADEAASFEESLDQASRGVRATDEQVQAVWAKHGL